LSLQPPVISTLGEPQSGEKVIAQGIGQDFQADTLGPSE
jgi:hypothetical protein